MARKYGREEITAILSEPAQPRHVVICRDKFGSYGKIPFSTLRGTNHQVWFELDATATEHLASHEPPAYGVVLIDQQNLVVHSHDFLDTSLRFPFAAPAGVHDRDYALNFPAR